MAARRGISPARSLASDRGLVLPPALCTLAAVSLLLCDDGAVVVPKVLVVVDQMAGVLPAVVSSRYRRPVADVLDTTASKRIHSARREHECWPIALRRTARPEARLINEYYCNMCARCWCTATLLCVCRGRTIRMMDVFAVADAGDTLNDQEKPMRS